MKITQFILIHLLFLMILLITNPSTHNEQFVFDRGFAVCFFTVIIGMIAGILIMIFMPDKELPKNSKHMPSSFEFFRTHKQRFLIAYIILISMSITIMGEGNITGDLVIRIIAQILVLLLCGMSFTLLILRKLEREWYNKNFPETTD